MNKISLSITSRKVKISMLFSKIPTDYTITNMFIKDATCFGRVKVSSFVII
jgi:hypothetical protein